VPTDTTNRHRAVAATAPTVALAPITLSAPVQLDLAIYRGDTGHFQVHLTDSLGQPVDVSTATWDADIRLTADDTTTVGSFVITTVDSATIDVAVDTALSEVLPPAAVWDLEMTNNGEVKTLLAGKITSTVDVSRV